MDPIEEEMMRLNKIDIYMELDQELSQSELHQDPEEPEVWDVKDNIIHNMIINNRKKNKNRREIPPLRLE